jgi:4-hydroxy-3-methylbut-2-enyl diphosphate reductase IspH
MQLMLCA